MTKRANNEIPEPLPWDRRANGASPLPGGYSGYLDSLRKICARVEQMNESFKELVDWMCRDFGISETSSRTRLGFLETVGLIYRGDGIVSLQEQVGRWLEGADDDLLIAVIHSRIRFVGEMLEELREPKSTERLRQIAAGYGLDWERKTQINNRRGWLESAKLIAGSSQDLKLTAGGESLLSRLVVHRPTEDEGTQSDDTMAREPPGGGGQDASRSQSAHNAEGLSSEILAASTDSADPARFERAVRDGFRFMGFVAEHLGGPGKTDVLVDGPTREGRFVPSSGRRQDDC